MAIKFSCPKCGQKASAPESAVGTRGKCPKCGASVVVPKASSPSTPVRVEWIDREEVEEVDPVEEGGKEVPPASARGDDARGSERVICFDCSYCYDEITITSTPGATMRCPHCRQTVRVPRDSKTTSTRAANPSAAKSRTCPECKGTIDAEAKRCPHCRHNLRPWYQRSIGWSLLGLAAIAIGLVLFWPEIRARLTKSLPIPPPSLDADGKGVASKMIEAWKVGDSAADCWAPDAAPSTLFGVSDYTYLKGISGDDAKGAWTLARMKMAEDEKDRDLLGVFDATERRAIERRYLEKLTSIGDQPVSGTYAVHRFRIQSTTKGGAPIDAMWDIILRKQGERWAVVGIVKTQ